MKTHVILFLLVIGCAHGQMTLPPGVRDGQVTLVDSDSFLAWDATARQWLNPEAFWTAFSQRGRGKTWPSDTLFPPYSDVGEHDTFLYLKDGAPCLMIFFHTRWRRGNDVWRWGPEFNEYGSCPNVFD